MTSLVNNLGGGSGFGENFLGRNDDGSTPFIDLRSIFGSQGINFFGQQYTGLFLNNNGSVTFNAALGAYTPTAITGATSNPIIAAYWADVDTRGGTVPPTPGGTSTGSNLLWYDLDSATRTFTATWDDVGYYNTQINKKNAFQISIKQIGDQGDFDITFRYENVDWTTGSASGGTDGLGGTPARAGYSSGNGVNFFEMQQSGNQAALLDLENASNIGTPGTFVFQVRSGSATPTISVGDATIVEGNGPDSRFVVIPVFLAAPSASTITVNYTTVDGSAIAGQDYVSQGGLLTFAPGVTQQNIFIEITGDTVIEGNETFHINLSNPIGAPVGDGDGLVTIVNDDGLVISDVSMVEGTGAAPTAFTFTVTLLSASAAAVSVDFATEAGSAASGTDFAAINGTLNFAAGEVSKTVTVNVVADSLSEADETFNVRLSNATGATIADAVGQGTIVNDDGLVVDDLTIVEGTAASPGTANVTIRLLSAASGPVSVDWATTPGGATSPADFTASNGTVTFAAGETVKTVQIPIVRDAAIEGTESFNVVLSNANGTAIVDGNATVTILDDDGFSVSDAIVTEGNAGTTNLVFTVSLGSALATNATVQFATANGTATAGSDYTAANGTLTFLAGETTKTVTVAVTGDLDPEADETLTLNLSNPSAGTGIIDGSATGTIFNDDGLSVGNASVTEGNAGTATVDVTVTLSAAATVPITVNYATQDGTAVAGVDYVATNGTLNFAVGETTKTIQVQVNGDTLFEGNETFRVVLSNPTGTRLVDGTGTVTILNDDARPPPSFRIVDAALVEGTGPGTSVMRFQVALTEVAASASSVDYATSNGTAAAGSDYTATTGTLTIPAGSLFGFIDVPITRDAAIEGDETLTVTLSNPSAGTAILDGTATGTILNDDVSLSIAATSANKAEGNSGNTPFTFTVTRTGDTTIAHSADWAVSVGSANAADFGGALPTGTVTFAGGETTKVITVNVRGDTVVEGNDSFTVTLSNASAGAVIDTATANGTIRNDDASLAIAATSADKEEGNSGNTDFTFTVTRTGDTTGPDSATWAVIGPAVDGADFAGGSVPFGVVNFAAGETSKTITVEVAGDTAVESDEGFTVALSNPTAGAVIGTATATGTIRNDDASAPASLAIAPTSADKTEGQSGPKAFTFTVTRTGDTTGASSASWAVSGAAVNGADFTGGVLPSGTVSFAAGETSKVVSVSVKGDTAVEANESFTIILSNPSAGTVIGTATANGTIRNDDASLGIAATSADKAEGNAGSTTFTFTVTRTGDTSGADSASWAVSGAAVNATDFTGGVLPSGTVNFAAGETSKVVTVNVAGDSAVEADEAFTVTLSNPSAGAVIGTASVNGTIRNDDASAASLAIAPTSADKTEGLSGSKAFTFTVTRTGNTSGASTANWAVSGAAVTAGDFAGGVLPSGTVTFAAGQTSKTITVNVKGDNVKEADEAFTVTLSNPSAGTVIATATANGIIRNDDGIPTPFDDVIDGTAGADYIDALAGDDIVSGLGGNDVLVGRDGNDTLNGGAGDDVMVGGKGNDRYVVNSLFDIVLEVDAAHGTDTVESTVSYRLGEHLEHLVLTGGANVDGTGNALANNLTGNGGSNVLSGGGGLDSLTGGGGVDTFLFDQALVAGNVTTVVDFAAASEKISLALSVFTAAGPAGSLNAAAFFIGAAAHDATDRIIYNSGNGNLMYDADGNGAGAAQTFAVLSPSLAMAAGNFLVAA